jgi:heat shock protein HslJ
MKRTVIIIWISIAVLVVLFASLGWNIFRDNQASPQPTSIPSATSVPTAKPSATNLPPTVKPSATSLPPTVKPSATNLSPTVKPSATSIPPTVKPSATNTPTSTRTATRVPPTATHVPPTSTHLPPTATRVPPTATRVPPTATVNPVQNINWQWLSVTDQSTGSKTVVPDPVNYTISFFADGTLSGLADCNTFKGTYSQSGGFTINIGVFTTVYCGESSLDDQYIQLLDNVASGGPDSTGGLALETAGGAQRMMFKNGGKAP